MQMGSFALFSALYGVFLIRVRKYAPEVWHSQTPVPWYRNWKALAAALALSCIGILVRPADPFRAVQHSD